MAAAANLTMPPHRTVDAHPSHGTSSFHSPSHPSPCLPLPFSYDLRLLKKPAASIGYACDARHSENMGLSLQWEKAGAIVRWEKERPFAVREGREREARRARGDADTPRRSFDLWSRFPPLVMPVPAPDVGFVRERNPLLLRPLSQPSSPPAVDSARRLRARRLLEEMDAYDPNGCQTAAALRPSHFTALYRSTAVECAAPKVSLLAHPASSYARAPGAVYRGSNHRWTEERLFFRGYRVGAANDAAAAEERPRRELRDLLFDAPLYSSFALDGVYREPVRTRGKKPAQRTRLPTPRVRQREMDDNDGAAVDEPLPAPSEQQPGGTQPPLVKMDIQLSGVYVPRAVSGRFVSSSQYPTTSGGSGSGSTARS